MQEMRVRSLGQEGPLEKETRSSILAWEIPRKESFSGLHTVYGVKKELAMAYQLNKKSFL